MPIPILPLPILPRPCLVLLLEPLRDLPHLAVPVRPHGHPRTDHGGVHEREREAEPEAVQPQRLLKCEVYSEWDA
jgi:hypothetical protein